MVDKENHKPSFDLRIVDTSSAFDLLCQICLGLLRQPKQCKNGHLFCEECIHSVIEKTPRCPTCRCTLNLEDLSRSLFVEKHLRTLPLWCTHHYTWEQDRKKWVVDEHGCKAIVELQNLEQHENECDYIFVECPNSLECKIRKREVERHSVECEWRLVRCENCDEECPAFKYKTHLLTCPGIIIKCQLCEESMKRGKLENHLVNTCPENLQECPYIGCEAKVKRKDLTEHLQNSIIEHLEIFRLSTQKLIDAIDTKYSNDLRRKEQEVKILKKKLASETRLIWKIEEWFKIKNYIQSKPFKLNGFEWFMGLYPDGDQEDSRQYLSVYLFLKESTKEKLISQGKSILVEFKITLVNHKTPKRSIQTTYLKTRFPTDEGQGWGERLFTKKELVTEEAGYILDGAIHLVIDLAIKQVIINI